MLLNGIRCDGFTATGKDGAEFSLSETTVVDAAALDGQDLEVTEDDGETLVASFAGFGVTGVWESGGSVRLRAARQLSTEAAEAIHAVEQNITVLTGKVTAAEASAADAVSKAEEAQQTAEQAGTQPSVKAAAAMFVNASTTLTNSELGDVRDLIDDFVQGAEYEKGAIRKYDGKFYRMAQKIDSTTSQTYLPGTGTESLYTLIDLAADGIRIWHAPTDATNSFAFGEKAHHPGEDGPVYVSKREGNTSEPGTDEWWVLDGTEE